MQFLDYSRVRDWAQIMGDSVRSTEGVTQQAHMCVQAFGADVASDQKGVGAFCIRARIEPTYFRGQLFMRYDTGRRVFDRLPVFEGNARAISKMAITFQDVLPPKEEGAEFRIFAETLRRQMGQKPILLEHAFPVPSAGSLFRITSHDLREPIFTEPDTGTTVPLWFVGGILSQAEPLTNEAGLDEVPVRLSQNGKPTLGVEPLFAFPNVDPKHPLKANVELWRGSTLTAKDPRFAQNRSPLFTWFPHEAQAWTLSQVVEEGTLTLDLPEGRFTSKQLLKGEKEDEVWITFGRLKKEEV